MNEQTQNDGGPAFPRPASEYEPNELRTDGLIAVVPYTGMSLRDYFAAHASEQDIIQAWPWVDHTIPGVNPRQLARYFHADAMLKARAAK